MKKILLIAVIVIGWGMLSATGILFPSEVKACGNGGSTDGHNHGTTGYQVRPATPPPGPYGYYGNPNSYNQGTQGDGQMMYGGGTGNNRGPEAYSDGAQGHQNH